MPGERLACMPGISSKIHGLVRCPEKTVPGDAPVPETYAIHAAPRRPLDPAGDFAGMPTAPGPRRAGPGKDCLGKQPETGLYYETAPDWPRNRYRVARPTFSIFAALDLFPPEAARAASTEAGLSLGAGPLLDLGQSSFRSSMGRCSGSMTRPRDFTRAK